MFNEKGIIKKVKNGDKQAMELLYKAYFKPLYIFIRAKVNANEQAEDICSEVFIKAFESISKFKEESSFKTWIYAIAKNVVFDSYKKNSKLSSVELDEELIEDPSTSLRTGSSIEAGSVEADLNKFEKMVKNLLGRLPENYRQILELRFLLNYNIKESAEIMNITPNNAKVLQNRAIKKARSLINN
jgi:RNA polymerase sigma-70 factor (ECF subfamily)